MGLGRDLTCSNGCRDVSPLRRRRRRRGAMATRRAMSAIRAESARRIILELDRACRLHFAAVGKPDGFGERRDSATSSCVFRVAKRSRAAPPLGQARAGGYRLFTLLVRGSLDKTRHFASTAEMCQSLFRWRAGQCIFNDLENEKYQATKASFGGQLNLDCHESACKCEAMRKVCKCDDP